MSTPKRLSVDDGVYYYNIRTMRLIARVLHRSMFSFLRHLKACTFLSALLNAKSQKHNLPFFDLGDLDMYPRHLFAWSELRHLLLQQVVSVKSHRATVVLLVSLVVVFFVGIVGLIQSITRGVEYNYDTEEGCPVAFYVTIGDTAVLAFYMWRILTNVSKVNNHMRAHRNRLAAIKFDIEVHSWAEDTEMEESIKISDTDNSFNFEPDELEKWVRTRKLPC